MGKKIIIVGLLAAMLLTGGAVHAQYAQYGQYTTDIGRTLVLSAGAGGYFGFQLFHRTILADGQSPIDAFGDIKTETAMMVGGPLFIRLDLLTYLAVEASAYYKHYFDSGAKAYLPGGGNYVTAAFSIYGQFPREVALGIMLFPFVGAAYEMPFYGWNDSGSFKRGDSIFKDRDELLLKLGLGLNGNLTSNLRLNFRLGYDVVLYNKLLSDAGKAVSGGTLITLTHTPNVFLGLSYAFLKI